MQQSNPVPSAQPTHRIRLCPPTLLPYALQRNQESEAMSEVVNNKARDRYELVVDGDMAATYYELADNVITFVHTEVAPDSAARVSGQSWSRARSTR
jgi:hypothetical protein